MFYGILAIGKKSQTVQQHFTVLNNRSNLDLDEVNNTDTTDNIPEEDNCSSNLGGPLNIADTQPTPKKTRSARGDKLLPKHAKVTGGHVLAKSIVAIVEEMRANYKNK